MKKEIVGQEGEYLERYLSKFGRYSLGVDSETDVIDMIKKVKNVDIILEEMCDHNIYYADWKENVVSLFETRGIYKFRYENQDYILGFCIIWIVLFESLFSKILKIHIY